MKKDKIKKNINITLFTIAILLLGFNISASALSQTTINNKGIEISQSEYNNLLNLGFTDNEILNMTLKEYNENKNLKGEVVSKNIVYFDENEKINSKNNGIELFGIQNGSITTASKKMITTIVSVNNHYRYKVSLEWTEIPSTRSYDIIGLGIDNTVKVYSTPVFQQNFCYSSNNCSSSNTHTRNTSSVGIGASFRLPTVKLVSLSSYLYFDVEKRNSGTLTSQNAYGDYSHATKSISQEYITNYYVNRGGIILDSSISDYYDNITPAVAKWTGSW